MSRNERMLALLNEQFFYGHREILLEYMRLHKNNLFLAAIRHGKILEHNLFPILPEYDLEGRPLLQVLWRDDAVEEANAIGINEVVSIGAPILYALSNLSIDLDKIKSNLLNVAQRFNWTQYNNDIPKLIGKSRVLYMPLHSTELQTYERVDPVYDFLTRFDQSQLTVLLHYFDFCDPKIRGRYESNGWKVVCAGMRYTLNDSPSGGRENFLYELINIFQNTDFIIAEEFTTGLFYAAAIGKNIGMIPEPNVIKVDYTKYTNWIGVEAMNARIRNRYSWLIGKPTESEKIYLDLCTSLGINSFKSLSQLVDILPRTVWPQ